MAIDFTFPQEVDDARLLVRKFMQESVRPRMDALREEKASGDEWRTTIYELREQAKGQGLWAPHMPEDWGVWVWGLPLWLLCLRKPLSIPTGLI